MDCRLTKCGDGVFGSDDPIPFRFAGEGQLAAGAKDDGDAVEAAAIKFFVDRERQFFFEHGKYAKQIEVVR